jgi:hypothetical protein
MMLHPAWFHSYPELPNAPIFGDFFGFRFCNSSCFVSVLNTTMFLSILFGGIAVFVCWYLLKVKKTDLTPKQLQELLTGISALYGNYYMQFKSRFFTILFY